MFGTMFVNLELHDNFRSSKLIRLLAITRIQIRSQLRPFIRLNSSVKMGPIIDIKVKEMNGHHNGSTGSVNNVANSAPKVLFTPGPLNTSEAVKSAMLVDYGSRDIVFIDTIKFIRSELLSLAGCDPVSYAAVPLQGCGTYAVESLFCNIVGKRAADKQILVLCNGAYANRMRDMCQAAGYFASCLTFPETGPMDLAEIESELSKEPNRYSLVAMVHCETSTGAINPIKKVGQLVKRINPRIKFAVDAMSSFGAVEINMPDMEIDFLVSSANKCLEGVPGFSYVIADKDALYETKGNCPILSFDLCAQYENLEKTGQFRFTPPTHVMAAFKQALVDYKKQGGLEARKNKYLLNYQTINQGMSAMGFRKYLADEIQSYIITSYYFPQDSNFEFKEFYQRLSAKGLVIYPGKSSAADCFRIGNIGHIFEEDCENLVTTIRAVLLDMKVAVPLRQP